MIAGFFGGHFALRLGRRAYQQIICRRQFVAKSHMRSAFVIFDPPGFDQALGFADRLDPVDIQAFVPQRSVERLDEGAVGWLPRP